jgi:hypothetical protein
MLINSIDSDISMNNNDLTGKPDGDVSTEGEELLRTYDVYVLVLTITIAYTTCSSAESTVTST